MWGSISQYKTSVSFVRLGNRLVYFVNAIHFINIVGWTEGSVTVLDINCRYEKRYYRLPTVNAILIDTYFTLKAAV